MWHVARLSRNLDQDLSGGGHGTVQRRRCIGTRCGVRIVGYVGQVGQSFAARRVKSTTVDQPCEKSRLLAYLRLERVGLCRRVCANRRIKDGIVGERRWFSSALGRA